MTKQIKTTAYYWHKGKKRYLAKMHECAMGGEHEPMDGVLYRRCKKCGNLYAVPDEEYIKRKGRSAVENRSDFDSEVL